MNQHRPQIDIIHFDHVSLYYPSGIPVFYNVSCTLHSGKFYFLTGASGAGKTSLMKLIYRAIKPSEGTITVFGCDIMDMNTHELPLFRQKMGLVFQDCRLLSHLNALDNVALALRIAGMELKRARGYAKELLDWVGLSEHWNYFPPGLSDGQKQRVGIARAIITRPLILLADEPTGNVDDQAAYKLIQLLEELNKIGTTILVATHNRLLVDAFNHTEFHLSHGQLSIYNPEHRAHHSHSKMAHSS